MRNRVVRIALCVGMRLGWNARRRRARWNRGLWNRWRRRRARLGIAPRIGMTSLRHAIENARIWPLWWLLYATECARIWPLWRLLYVAECARIWPLWRLLYAAECARIWPLWWLLYAAECARTRVRALSAGDGDRYGIGLAECWRTLGKLLGRHVDRWCASR